MNDIEFDDEFNRIWAISRGRRFVADGDLREFRVRAGLTVHRLAQMLDVTVDTIYAWQARRRLPRSDAAERLGQLIGAPIGPSADDAPQNGDAVTADALRAARRDLLAARAEIARLTEILNAWRRRDRDVAEQLSAFEP